MKTKIHMLFILTLALTSLWSMPVFAGYFDDPDYCTKHPDDFLCYGEEQTAFTDFQGQFKIPDTSDYSSDLVKTTSLREFVIQLTNFIISFLGLAAVIAVIYGGVIYITSGGQQEKADTGKKVITYALMGLIVVLVSFALVNTVISGALGEGEPGSNTGITDTPGHGSSDNSFTSTSSAAASEVQDIAEDIVTAYQKRTSFLETTERTSTFVQAQLSRTSDWSDPATYGSEFIAIIGDIRSELVDMLNSSEPLSNTEEELRKVIESIDTDILIAADINKKVRFAQVLSTDILIAQAVSYACASTGCSTELNAIKNALDGPISTAIKDDYKAAITDGNNRLTSLRENFTDIAVFTEDGKRIYDKIDEISTDLTDPATTDNPTNDTIRGIIDNLKVLNNTLVDVQSTQAVIKASTTTGNAPLTVIFDGTDSIDPSGNTPSDNNYCWDLTGNNVNYFNISSSAITCSLTQGPLVSKKFSDPGVYKVGMKFLSQQAGKYATGYATITIKVTPPTSTVIVKVGSETIDAKYSSTLALAKQGLTFNASDSHADTSIDASNAIQKYTFDFDDGSSPISQTGASYTYQYGEEGKYNVSVEVEDKLGNKDRKTFELFIGSPVAKIRVTPKSGDINTIFKFDGSDSRTDEGQIVDYKWTIGADMLTGELIDYQFTGPGTYNVKLEVEDSLGKIAETTMGVEVISNPPVATFSYEIRDKNKANVITVDAAKSSDPDGDASLLTYEWSLPDLETTEYSIADSAVKRTEITVYRTGETRIELKVTDAQSTTDEVVKTVKIQSTLQVGMNIGPSRTMEQLAYQLSTIGNEQKVNVTFWPDKSSTTNPIAAYELDFGDEEQEVLNSDRDDSASGDAPNIIHTFTEAGLFTVQLTVFDKENNDNSLKMPVYIGTGDKPIAVIAVDMDGNPVDDIGQTLEAYKTSKITFDGSKSINTDGTGRKLDYYWEVTRLKESAGTCTDTEEPGTTQANRQKTFAKSFSDTGCYGVKLTVSDRDDVSSKHTSNRFKFKVIDSPPTFDTIVISPQSQDLTTPLKVQIKVMGAEDLDGKIEQYRYWYYPFDDDPDTDDKGYFITGSNQATLTINTFTNFDADGDGKVIYGFGVELVDNEGNTFSKTSGTPSSDDELDELTVKNGTNLPPTVILRSDRTAIFKNEVITFTAEAEDPDGEVVTYEWDFNGNRIFGQTDTTLPVLEVDGAGKTNLGPVVQREFPNVIADGVPIRVRVYDEGGSQTTSSPLTIYVDSDAEKPIAAFEIKNILYETGISKVELDASNSTVDPDITFKKMVWDCDTKVDSDGNDAKDDDEDIIKDVPSDANFKKATCEYDYYESVKIKLTVIDSEDTSAEKIIGTELKEPVKLDARLKTSPSPNQSDGKIHLTGEVGYVQFDSRDSQGLIARSFVDKNIVFDTNGNGVKDDDEDILWTPTGTSASEEFRKEWGKIITRLTVEDGFENTDSVDIEIVFDKAETGGEINLLGTSLTQGILAVLAGLWMFGILGITHAQIFGKRMKLKRRKIGRDSM